MKNIIVVLIGVSCLFAVPLENWRMPFYRIAVEQGEVCGAPSGMFWDEMPGANMLDDALWIDSAKYREDHWFVEPNFSCEVSNDKYISGKRNNIHIDFFSDFKFKNLLVRTVLDVDQTYKNDPDFVWKKDRVAAGRIEEAYLQYTNRFGFIRLGRVNRNWGPFYDRSVLLSNNTFSYDAFEWQLTFPFFEYRYLFTGFPRLYSWKDTYGNNAPLDRYLGAHALNFIFGDWGSIGVSETVLFSRQNGLPDFQYINPFSIYTVINTNAEGAANLMFGIQGWVHPFSKKITLKAQLVFDDVQVDNETEGDKEPTHWAGDFGCYWTDPLPLQLHHHFSFEYGYRSKWMYTVSDPNTKNGERYTYLGRSLGVEDIDGDNFMGSFNVQGKNYWAGSIGLGYKRQDTNTVHTLWNSDAALGYTKEESLSKRTHLKTTIILFFAAHGYFKDYCDIHLNFENRWIKDEKMSDKYTYDPRISLSISAHYSDLFVRFKKKN